MTNVTPIIEQWKLKCNTIANTATRKLLANEDVNNFLKLVSNTSRQVFPEWEVWKIALGTLRHLYGDIDIRVFKRKLLQRYLFVQAQSIAADAFIRYAHATLTRAENYNYSEMRTDVLQRFVKWVVRDFPKIKSQYEKEIANEQHSKHSKHTR